MLGSPLCQDPEQARAPVSDGSPGGPTGSHRNQAPGLPLRCHSPDFLRCPWRKSGSRAGRAWCSPCPGAKATPAPTHRPVGSAREKGSGEALGGRRELRAGRRRPFREADVPRTSEMPRMPRARQPHPLTVTRGAFRVTARFTLEKPSLHCKATSRVRSPRLSSGPQGLSGPHSPVILSFRMISEYHLLA